MQLLLVHIISILIPPTGSVILLYSLIAWKIIFLPALQETYKLEDIYLHHLIEICIIFGRNDADFPVLMQMAGEKL